MPGKNKYTLGAKEPRFDITLPSGETCQVRRPGVQGLIKAGVLDSFDTLTSLVQQEINRNTPQLAARQAKADIAAEVLRDPSKIQAGLEMIDRLAAYIITAPVVWCDFQLPKESDEDFETRKAKAIQDEAVPTSAIDDNDKIFVMNFAVGGSADLTAFRAGLAETVGDLEAVASVPLPTE